MKFEEWYLGTFGETVESASYGHEMGNYTGPPDPCSIKSAWQAATLAERERAECAAHAVMMREDIDWGMDDVLAAIRKGEGV